MNMDDTLEANAVYDDRDEEEVEKDIEAMPEEKKPQVPISAWFILMISSFGVFLASVSTSALIIAFPVVLVDLNMTITTLMWVLLVLLLMLAAVVPTAGKLGDIIGQSRVYIVGYWTFVIGSLGAGFVSSSNQGYDLIAARVVIGFGAALLFTNSSAILTNAFAPYGKVGLAQGVFQLFSAMGIVFGPLIGGGFATSNWRWIFWFNAPTGGVFAVAAVFLVTDKLSGSGAHKVGKVQLSTREHAARFDVLGSISCVCCFTLVMIALVQVVVADPVLSTTNALIGLIVGGCAAGVVFVIDQFWAVDALIPPKIFNNRIYSLTTAAGTFMAFARNSITYNMIFFLQGPLGQNPLDAGISLIPFGIGIMVAGFCAGALTDKIGSRNMAFVGPLVAMSGVACLSVMNQNTTTAYVGGILFLSGFGIGLFQSPNSAANMLSVDTHMRGVAAAVNMLTMSFMMMLGIVLTFYFVLHSMTATQLFDLFIYGGAASNPSFPMQAVLNALSKDYYIVIACCISASACAFCLPTNMNDILKQLHAPNTQHSVDGDVEIGKASQEKALDSEDGIEQTFVESKESGLEMNQGFHNKEVLTQ